MGNLGKIKKKLRKAQAILVELNPEGEKILKRLVLGYGNLLEYKEWDKAKVLVQWAIEKQDPLAMEAIKRINYSFVEELKLKAIYQSLPLEKQLTFLLDNQHYVEEFFSNCPPVSVLELSPNKEKVHQEYKELHNNETNELLSNYLQSIQKQAVQDLYEQDPFSYISKQTKK